MAIELNTLMKAFERAGLEPSKEMMLNSILRPLIPI